jgi:hypothetical protein
VEGGGKLGACFTAAFPYRAWRLALCLIWGYNIILYADEWEMHGGGGNVSGKLECRRDAGNSIQLYI